MSLESSRAETLGVLTAFRPTWSELRARRERTMVETKHGRVCGDPELELQWQATHRHMNHLLEGYFTLMSAVELPTKPGFYGTEIPVKHTSEVHSVGLEHEGA